jgi:threonine 3-dehydrogenase
MKALVKDSGGEGLSLKDLPIPTIGRGDVLIEIEKTAICGTDLHIYNYDSWAKSAIKIPVIVGHEFVGTIVATGDNVSYFKVGDVVSAEGHVVCNHCRNCLAGRKHLCANTVGIGGNRDGAFANFISLPQENLYLIDGLDKELAALLDPLGNATHTVSAFNLVGEDVLITGAGPIGLMAAAMAKHVGARKVVITDISEYRLDMAQKLGVDLAINVTRTSVSDAIKALSLKEGFDIGMEMSGNGTALNEMIDNMVMGGKIALLGIFKNITQQDFNKIVFKGITLKGVYGREIFESWYKSTAMLASGLDIKSIITHRFPFYEYETAFKLMQSGNCGKVILEWK